MSTPAFYWGTGRRKTAVARVRLIPGEGQMVVNGRTPEEHFGGILSDAELFLPFRVTGTEGRFNVMIKVEGGGTTGQAGAIRVARRPSVSSVASTTYQRRSISLSRGV